MPNFEQNQHIYIANFAFYKGLFIYQYRMILLPMLAAYPRRVFCTEYPPQEHKLWVT